jgi:hypothetical protein
MSEDTNNNNSSDLFEWNKRIDNLRVKAQERPLRLTPLNWHIQYLDEAVKCFHQNLPISCIIVSSTLVETSLIWERFRQNPKAVREKDSRRLSLNKMFEFFLGTNVPLEFLMDSDEDIASLRKTEKKETKEHIRNIRYVKTRNKFAHGDLFDQVIDYQTLLPSDKKEMEKYNIKEWQLGGKSGLRTVAYVHLSKSLRFIDAFTKWVIQQEEKENRLRKNHLFGVG